MKFDEVVCKATYHVIISLPFYTIAASFFFFLFEEIVFASFGLLYVHINIIFYKDDVGKFISAPVYI